MKKNPYTAETVSSVLVFLAAVVLMILFRNAGKENLMIFFMTAGCGGLGLAIRFSIRLASYRKLHKEHPYEVYDEKTFLAYTRKTKSSG